MLLRIALRRLTSPLGRRYITSMARRGKSLSGTRICNIVEKGNYYPSIDVEDRADIKNYKIYAIEIPDEGVTIKRVYNADHELILLADNRDFPGFPRCVHLDRLNYNPICGKVVWTWNRLD